jgi:hypothetical protein
MTEPYPPQPEEPRPPSSGAPYGQPYGQPSGVPYEQPSPPSGFAPGEPAPGQPFPGQPYPPPPPPKKSNVRRILLIVGGALAVLLVICLVLVFVVFKTATGQNAANAKEGDCLSGNAITSTTRQETQGLKITDCSKSDARYKVVGRVPDKTQAQADQSLCQPFVDQGAEIFYWQEKSPGAGTGTVLCLKNNK